MKLDAYIRVSQVAGREGESFQSPSQQEDAIRRNLPPGAEIAEVNTLDLDRSGGTADRPGFQRILRRIEAGAVDGITVVRADRFARSVKVAWECIERIQAAGGVFYSATEHVDLLSASGRFQFNVLMAMNQYQREMSMEGWVMAQRDAIGRGVYLARTPVGYMRERDENGRPIGPLVPHPDEAPVVQQAFRRRAEGKTLTSIALYMTEALGARHGQRWAASAVRYVLSNRAYRGESRRGELFNATAHEALVSEAEWREANKARGIPHGPRHAWLLSSFLRCAGCSYTMKAVPTGSKGRRYRYYRCSSHERVTSCPARAVVRAERVEDFVTGLLFARHELVLQGMEQAVDFQATAADLAEAEDAYEALAQMAAESRRPALMAGALKRAEEQVIAAEVAHANAKLLASGEHGVPGLFSLREWWPDMSLADQRLAVGGIMDCAFVRGSARDGRPLAERILPFWRGTAPDDLPAPGKFVAPRSFDWSEAEIREAILQEAPKHAL